MIFYFYFYKKHFIMKDIKVLYGHSNCGKSETLNYVRELIRSNGGACLSANPPYNGDRPETFRYNGMIVSICPGGDTADIIYNNFQYAYAKKADIIITASRSRGKGCSIIENEAIKNNAKIHWLKKSREYMLSQKTQDACNREYAKVIFDTL